MIVPMTKYSFLVYHREYESFLEKLRVLGIAHIVENNKEYPEDIREKFQHINQLNKTIRFLENRLTEKKSESVSENNDNGISIFEEVNSSIQKLEVFKQKLSALEKEKLEIEPWGRFDISYIKKLKDSGLNIRFFVCQNRKFDNEWTKIHHAFVINEVQGIIYFVLIEPETEKAELNAEEVPSLCHTIDDLERSIDNVAKNIDVLNQRLNTIAETEMQPLFKYKHQLIDEIELEKARYQTIDEVEESVKIIETWCPNDKTQDLEDLAQAHHVVSLKSQPEVGEKVPVLLKNKRFNKDFEMIGEMYSLPKYGEMDLTPFFAPFYALFFGFCLGDVGYGILMLLAAFIFRPKVAKELKSVMNLIAYLGTATILFGLIGGTFFGINLYHTNLPIYSTLQSYFVANNTDINNFLFYLSLAIGGVQIIFGLILKAFNETMQFGWKVAVGTMGWILLLLGMVSVFALQEFSSLPAASIGMIQNVILVMSGLMILLFNNLKRKIYINLGVGLWDSYNMVTGILGDLLSYIRLFALGISSAILGFVFNSLAVSMSGDLPVISIVFMIIILVIGHSINLFMSGLGAFVHPMRLTFVEFYKNSGFTGGGKKYQPFRKLS
jgi:V/A-type H+-transporting ATPase subunit I